MVGDPVLLVVVRADLLGASTALDLLASRRAQLGVLAFLFDLQQARAQDPQRLVLVLQLALLVLAGDDEARRLVRDPYRRVGRVHRLAPRTGGAEHIDLEVVRVEVDVDLLGLRQHRDGCRARVDPPLALGGGNPLYAMWPTLVLEARPRGFALDDERHVPEAAVFRCLLREHFELQPAALGESLVHAEEVSGPEVRFLAALRALDLDDDVATLVGIARQQELADLGRELLDDVRLFVDLRLQVLAHLVVGFGREELVGVVETGRRFFPRAIRGDERLQLGVPASGVARGAPVARCEDPGKVRLQPIELALEFFELLEHDSRVPGG